MIAFDCPLCGKALKVKDEFSGKKGQCPRCKSSLRVPPAEAKVETGEEPTRAPNAPVPSEEPTLASADKHLMSQGEPGATVAEDGCGGVRPDLIDFLAPPQAADELGRLGAYRILNVLGAGGMGVVYRAEDPQLKRSIALKAMLPGLGSSPQARARFLREAQMAASLTHDHIVTIHQVGEDRGVPFMAMQFLEGEALEDRLHRERILPVPEILRIGRETAEGLQAAHEHGLIHRDIKPANLWLEGKRARVKILDFGAGRTTNDDAKLTQTGAIIGTPAYMAPEQVAGQQVDARCDLFSLGCVLYRMTAGKPPFTGDDTISTLMAVATEQPPAPRAINRDVPAALSDLILRLLAKKPEDRPKSAQEVVDMLRAIETAPAPVVKSPPRKQPAVKIEDTLAAEEPPPRKKKAAKADHRVAEAPPAKSGKLGVLLVVLLLLIALGTGGFFLARAFRPAPPGPAPPGGDPNPPGPIVAAKPENPWQPLFNGKDLTGWTVHDGKLDNWGVGRDILFTHGKDRGWLMTQQEFGDFEVRLEYRMTKRANSGVALRAPLEGDPAYTGMEVQILDEDSYPKRSPVQATGSIFGVAASSLAEVRPPGQWNQMHIAVRGRHVTVDLNGSRVLVANLDQYKKQEAKHPGLLRTRGRIGLQSLTSHVDFRELFVLPILPPRAERKPSPLDRFFRETMPGHQLNAAGGGDRHKAPAELVAVFRDPKAEEKTGVENFALSPDGRWLAMASWGRLRLVDLTTRRTPDLDIEGKGLIRHLTFSPDSLTLAGSGGPPVRLWRLHDGKNWVLWPAGIGRATRVVFSPDGKLLAVARGKEQPFCKLIQVNPWKEAKALEDTSSRVHHLAFQPEGQVLVIGGGTVKKGSLRAWDTQTGKMVRKFTVGIEEEPFTFSLSFRPDGSLLASTRGTSGVVVLWDPSTGKPRSMLTGHSSKINSLAFSPDGKTLASCSTDGTIRLWDPDKAREKRLIVVKHVETRSETATHGSVLRLAWAPDGRHLFALASDGTVWLLRTGDLGGE
jgi:serine/threonine protein kinase/sugar lactone lactonase YvrE